MDIDHIEAGYFAGEMSFLNVNLLEFVVMSLDKFIRNSSKYIATMYKQVVGVRYR